MIITSADGVDYETKPGTEGRTWLYKGEQRIAVCANDKEACDVVAALTPRAVDQR